jgi:hypothetical protein
MMNEVAENLVVKHEKSNNRRRVASARQEPCSYSVGNGFNGEDSNRIMETDDVNEAFEGCKAASWYRLPYKSHLPRVFKDVYIS